MKRRLSKDKYEARKKMILASFIVAIMVLSTIGFVLTGFGANANEVQYGDYLFKQTTQQTWETKINKEKREFFFYPAQLTDLTLDEATTTALQSKALSLTYDPNTTNVQFIAEVQFDFQRRLDTYAGIFATSGIIDATGTTVPQITCDDATESSPVIFFSEANETTINTENNCVVVAVSHPADALRVSERFLFKILDVMP